MRKNFYFKSIAIVICLVVLGITASGLYATDKKVTKFDSRLLIQRPFQFFISMFPFLNAFLTVNPQQELISTTSDSTEVIKPTGELDRIRVIIHD